MLAGMDVSGCKGSGNHQFMAIVIGTDEGVASVIKNLGSDRIHMRALSRSERNAVLGKVQFDGRSLAGFCMRLDQNRALSTVMGHLKDENRCNYLNRKKVIRTCHAIVWSLVREPVESFLWPHRCSPRDLVFQCDADCRAFASDQGWRHKNRGPAYALADILAWGNSHGAEPQGTVHLDLADQLANQMLKRFK